MAIHSMQQILEYVENEKLEQVIMAAERKHKEIAARTAKGVDKLWRKGQEAGSGGGNICLADNRNEDVDPG